MGRPVGVVLVVVVLADVALVDGVVDDAPLSFGRNVDVGRNVSVVLVADEDQVVLVVQLAAGSPGVLIAAPPDERDPLELVVRAVPVQTTAILATKGGFLGEYGVEVVEVGDEHLLVHLGVGAGLGPVEPDGPVAAAHGEAALLTKLVTHEDHRDTRSEVHECCQPDQLQVVAHLAEDAKLAIGGLVVCGDGRDHLLGPGAQQDALDLLHLAVLGEFVEVSAHPVHLGEILRVGETQSAFFDGARQLREDPPALLSYREERRVSLQQPLVQFSEELECGQVDSL
mmetsp:Transcript_5498/g.13000  ORF Transcript_5498/g.13000 Transcript_5498/m.13000 type:complete len:284 (+) Transcript_5498:336-1187(+)